MFILTNLNSTVAEIKRSLTPSISKGFIIGCEDIKATHRYFVYPGYERFPLSKDITAIPLKEMMMNYRRF